VSATSPFSHFPSLPASFRSPDLLTRLFIDKWPCILPYILISSDSLFHTYPRPLDAMIFITDYLKTFHPTTPAMHLIVHMPIDKISWVLRKLYTIQYLCIKCSFVIRSSKFISVYNNKIWCRTILWSRITPFSAQLVGCMMIGIVVRINNELSSVFPNCIPASISYSSAKHKTCFVNTNIIWPWFLSWIYWF